MAGSAFPYRGFRNYDALRKWNQALLKRINDIYIDSQLTVEGLRALKATIPATGSGKSKMRIVVPSVKGRDLEVLRKHVDIHRMLDARIASREYIQSLVFAIALTEEYLSDVLRLVIMSYPNKLLISTKGNVVEGDQNYTVDLRDVLRLGTVDALIREKSEQRVRSAVYASPRQYCTYIASVLGFSVPQETLDRFFEFKASRDIFVHNGGVVNAIYVEKAGVLARAQSGHLLPMDDAYLKTSIACMKKIFTSTYKGMLEKYGNSIALHAIIDTREFSGP